MAKEVYPSLLGADLKPEQFAGIGRVAVEWAFLEWFLHTVFCAFTGFRTERLALGELIAARIRRVDVLIEIIKKTIPKDWDEARRQRFIEVLGDVLTLSEQRDHVLHWTWWGIAEDPERAYAESKTSAGKPPPMRKSAKELEALALKINETASVLAMMGLNAAS